MADRHKEAKSKYTADRGMPGAFEGETVTRRRFMNLTTQGAGIIAAASFTLPALGFAIGPLFSRVPFEWQPIGVPTDFPDDTYVTKVLTIVPGIGNVGKSIAYVRARNPAIDTEPEDQYNHFVALSSRCMHLGCPVRFTACRRALHLPVPRRRLQLPGGPDRRTAGAAAGPLLHAAEQRIRRARSALLGQLRASPLLAA